MSGLDRVMSSLCHEGWHSGCEVPDRCECPCHEEPGPFDDRVRLVFDPAQFAQIAGGRVSIKLEDLRKVCARVGLEIIGRVK